VRIACATQCNAMRLGAILARNRACDLSAFCPRRRLSSLRTRGKARHRKVNLSHFSYKKQEQGVDILKGTDKAAALAARGKPGGDNLPQLTNTSLFYNKKERAERDKKISE